MKTALVVIAKNEDNYLKEWIDYNEEIGFDDIFVCQNNWRYHKGDITNSNVHFVECDGHRMQNTCYKRLLDEHYQEYDFIAFFDVDEFIHIKSNMKINEFLEGFTDAPLVYVNWRIFGDNGHDFVENDDYSCLKRFTKCDDKLWPLGKCIINTHILKNNVIFHDPHIVLDENGRILRYILPNHDVITRPWIIPIDEMYKFKEQPAELWHFRNKTYQECYDRKFGQDDVQHEASTFDVTSNLDAFNNAFEQHNLNRIDVKDVL